MRHESTNHRETLPHAISTRLRFSILAAILVAGLLPRVWLASTVEHPGPGDYSFYFTSAENLVLGRGLVVDYIWHFLDQPEKLTQPSTDYWMPLTSLIVASSFSLFGISVKVALVPSILCGLAIAVVTFRFARSYSGSDVVAYASAAAALFSPQLFTASLLCDSTIYYALFVALAMVAMVEASEHRIFFIASAVWAGLAHLTRQDGVLVFLVLLVVISTSAMRFRSKLAWGFLALATYLCVLAPLLFHNFRSLGTFLATTSSKTIFLTEYEDLYAYGKPLDLVTFLDWGLPNIVGSKLVAMLHNLHKLARFLAYVLWPLVLLELGAVAKERDREPARWTLLKPLLFMLAAFFLFYSLVATFPGGRGGFARSAASMLPFLLVLCLHGWSRLAHSQRRTTLGATLIVAGLLVLSLWHASSKIDRHTRLSEALAAVSQVIAKDAGASTVGPIVVMTRQPWEVYHSTRLPAIQIPNNGGDVIYDVARKFGASYLLLPAPREALMPYYEEEKSDSRFRFVSRVDGTRFKVFRIQNNEVGSLSP